MEQYSIALDGPAGAGKSTVAKELSKRLDEVIMRIFLSFKETCGEYE